MDIHQLRKATVDGTELEYYYDNTQWLPAIVSSLYESNAHLSHITIQLLRYPRGRSDIVHLSVNDIEHNLRVKSSDV